MLGAQLLTLEEDDIGPRMLRIPGISNGRFLPNQVWGVWYIVERILADRPPVALIGDDMGLGKTHCALATLLYLKYIINQAAAGRPLPSLGGKSVVQVVAQFERVMRIFGVENEIYRQRAIIIVSANLLHAWKRVTQSLIKGTWLNLINLYTKHNLSHSELNYSSDNPETGRAIHVISYSTYQTCYSNLVRLQGCQWGVGIFDEFHMAKS